MDNNINLLEEFQISELEDRVEFGLCGSSGGGTGGSPPEHPPGDRPQN